MKEKGIVDAVDRARSSAWSFAQSLAYATLDRQSIIIDKRDHEARLLGDVILADDPLSALIRRKESQDIAQNIRMLDLPAAGAAPSPTPALA